MIAAHNLVKIYDTRHGQHTVLDNINFKINLGDKSAVIGRNGSGKSTLIRLLSGIESPTSGKIIQNMSMSWPLAFSGGFQGSLTGIDNMKFICRVYNVDPAGKEKTLDEFTELGKFLREEVKKYSAGMRARLAFGISLLVDFQCYLVDEITAVGDAAFQEKCRYELFVRRAHKTMIIVSHEEEVLRDNCNRFFLINDKKLYEFENADDAFDYYHSIL